MSRHKKATRLEQAKTRAVQSDVAEADFGMEPNNLVKCDVCGEIPTVGESGLCGPCCFGEAATAGGKW